MRDSDVRKALRQRLVADHAGDSDTLIVEEMGVWSGSVRIDLAVINGELCGFELKSDRDTLARLPLQAELYSRVFDRLVLVVGERHAAKAVAHVPAWWGVILAAMEGDSVTLTHSRPPQPNPAPDPYLVAQLLWREEALAVLTFRGLAKGWRGKRIKLIHQRLAAELPFVELSAHVREALKRRTNWLGNCCAGHLHVPVNAELDPSL
ncbi:sce7726 family protein [Geminicoccus harenae]|uniref:sce7726 family protein n=1 Tax=Geminicoccus harenae TaxID=2498453 RepID=UPI00168A4C3C|nr:sce7726 family protein [Geminicoccus harenae]